MNLVILIGNLGKDPEVRFTSGGTAACNFSVATTEKWTDKSGQKQERTNWHRISCFGKLAELCGEYLKKGQKCAVEGRIQYGEYEKDGVKKYTTEIVADSVEFLSGKPEHSQLSQGTDEDPPF